MAQRKNKSRKPKSPKQDFRINLANSSPASTSSAESKETPTIDDIELIATVDPVDEFNVVDICDIAERCVLEEIGGDVNIDDVNINLDLDTLEFDLDPESIFQITPSLKLTIEEEYKICEIEAAKDLIIKSVYQTLVENVPKFQETISLFLYSRALGVSFDMTPEKVLSMMRKCRYAKNANLLSVSSHSRFFPREAVVNDMIFGGHMNQALNRLEIFSHIPQDLKLKLFTSTLGRVDIFKRYFD